MKRLHIVLLLLFLLYSSRSANAQGLINGKPLADIERSMESNLTWNLQTALSAYYPETKFVVNANVKLVKIQQRPSLPRLPEALLTKDITKLPGLPYVPEPEAFAAPPDPSSSLNRSALEGQYDVSHVRVNVLVDRSLSESDWAFIKRFVALTANLEPGRGDMVRIESLSFPERNDFKSTDPEEARPAPIAEPVTQTPEKAAFNWTPYVFAALLATFLLMLFLIGMRSITKQLKPENKQQSIPQQQLEAPVKAKEHSESVKTDTQQTFPELQSSAIDAFVGTPSASAKVFNQWITDEGDSGVLDAATTIAAVSRASLDCLSPYLGEESVLSIQKQMLAIRKPDETRALPLLQRFDDNLRILALQSSKHEEQTEALAFLSQMTDEQIQHLLKPLKVGVKAIVLAHLRSNRASKILSKLEDEEQKAVLSAIGNIQRIPLDVYQHVARQLASRANELRKMRYVRSNGIDALVKLLEQLDDYSQDDFLAHLQTRDVNLHQKVSKNFVTFTQVLDMPANKLREIALEVDRDTLAKSLVHVDEVEVERIINALPEKLAEMVRASMEASNDLPEEDIETARRNLMRWVRNKQVQVV